MARFKVLATMFMVLTLTGCGNVNDSAAMELQEYARWQSDVKQVTDPVIPWLRDRSARGGKNLAIVLDIDNTALETEYNPSKPNKPVLAVADWARTNNVAVLFVTFRDDSDREATLEQLTNARYPVDGLCMKTTGEETKPRCREALTAQGYTITANIGNRDTDFDGGNYEKAYRLPNYDNKLD